MQERQESGSVEGRGGQGEEVIRRKVNSRWREDGQLASRVLVLAVLEGDAKGIMEGHCAAIQFVWESDAEAIHTTKEQDKSTEKRIE